ncbi:hypothetical protein EI94DRAFT_1752751 [Lactarius quietus]|nr:hypothetical protein EI94DRAFT_1752751 [Lactarius quietus]
MPTPSRTATGTTMPQRFSHNDPQAIRVRRRTGRALPGPSASDGCARILAPVSVSIASVSRLPVTSVILPSDKSILPTPSPNTAPERVPFCVLRLSSTLIALLLLSSRTLPSAALMSRVIAEIRVVCS